MEPKYIKTGDIFYFDTYTPHDNKTHRHKCRVLFVGTESIFYDAWWDGISKWTFIPVLKRFSYYRFPLNQLSRLKFDGFEPIDKRSADKLFLDSPEILLNVTKSEFKTAHLAKEPIKVYSDTIAFIPTGPKGGALKPILFESKELTKRLLIEKISEYQNLDFIQKDEVVLHRVGLHSGYPSYCIKNH